VTVVPDTDVATPLPAGRRAVLYAVRRRGEATAGQVAEQLDITVSGARQHLAALVDNGLLTTTTQTDTAARRGRRALVYSVTPASDGLFPKAHGELTNELLGYVVDHDPELLDTIFGHRRQRRIDTTIDRLAKRSTVEERVAELTRVLDEDGYMATYEEVEPGVFVVIEHNCAIWAVAQRYGQACSSELDFIRGVLPNATVERVQHMVAGARHCAYEIRTNT
jgi:DeoR family suf operon transcriptional repressor